MTWFWCSLLGWYRMYMKLLNNTSAIVVKHLQAELCMSLTEIIDKMIIISNHCIYLIYIMLGFIPKGLVLTIYLDRPSLAKGLMRTNLVVTKCNLWFFGAKSHRKHSPPLISPTLF